MQKNIFLLNKKKDTRLDNSLKFIAKTSIIAFIFILSSKIITYFYRIVIARDFGPEIYGLFSLAIMVSGWLVAVFSLGLPDGTVRFISIFRSNKEAKKIEYQIKFSVVFLFFSGIIAAFVLFFFSEYISMNIFHNSNLIIFLKLFSISIPFSISASLFLSILQAHEKVNWYSFIRNILDTGIKLIFLLILIFFGLGTDSIIFSYIFGILAMFLVSYYVSKFSLKKLFEKTALKLEAKKEIIKNLLSYSWPLIFVSIISFIFSWTDSFMIGYFNIEGRGVYNVGIYNSAIPLAALLVIAPSLFIQIFFPIINKEYAKKNSNTIKEISKQVVKWIFLLNLPLLILIILFPGAIINLFFGNEYILAANSLRFLAIGMFFYSIFIISENLISMVGKSKIVLLDILIASILNIILNAILVPKYNINGAAFATMITYIVWSLISLFQAKYYVSIIPLRKKMIFILLISMIPTFLLIYIKQFILVTFFTLIIQGFFFLLLYLFLIILAGGFDRNDVMVLSSIKKKIIN